EATHDRCWNRPINRSVYLYAECNLDAYQDRGVQAAESEQNKSALPHPLTEVVEHPEQECPDVGHREELFLEGSGLQFWRRHESFVAAGSSKLFQHSKASLPRLAYVVSR